MALIRQNSFAHGIVAPAVYGRADLDLYTSSLREARNCIIRLEGGLSNRQGLPFITPCKDHTYAPRIIDWTYKTGDSYAVEIGDGYVRFVRNDAALAEAAKAITGLTQANPAVATVVAHGYANGDEVEFDDVGGMSQINSRRFIVANATTDTFELTDQVTGANIDSTGYDAYTTMGTSSRIYTLAAPWAIADVPILGYEQDKDTVTFTHQDYPTYILSRVSATQFTLEPKTFVPQIDAPANVAVTVNTSGTVTAVYKVTAVAVDTAEESLPGTSSTTKAISAVSPTNPVRVTATAHGYKAGDEVYISGVVSGYTQVNNRRFIATNIATNTFDLLGEDGTGWTFVGSSTTTGTSAPTFVRITNSSATWQNTITCGTMPNAQAYNFYRSNGNTFGFLGQAATATWTDSNVIPSATITPPQANDPFKNEEYPGAFGFFSQRQVYGGSSKNPGRSHYTQTGAQNFNTSSPLQDDDAITADLVARRVNEIRHYVAGNDLIVFTNSAEWRVNSGPDSKFTFATIKQKPQTNWGSSRLKPWIVGSEVLFVEPSNTRVRNLAYNLEFDAYDSDDLSLLASHLLIDNPLTSWCMAYTYDQRMHGVCADGTMVAETYHSKQKVNGWSWWDTKGDFENCCALRTNQVGVGDSVYVVVKRKINGNTVRYIEKVSSKVFSDVRDAMYLDCSLSYDQPVAIENIAKGATEVFTITAHGFSNGQKVDVSDIEWWPIIDEDGTPYQPGEFGTASQFDGRFLVANVTVDTFTLQTLGGVDINSVGYQEWRKNGNVRIPVNTVGGLWHLEGETVSGLADGNVYETLLVTDGQVSLPAGVLASRIHIGIPYVSIFETLDMDSPQAILNGRLKTVSDIYVECFQSRGFFLGSVTEVPGRKTTFTKINWRTIEPMDKPTALYTGIKKIPLDWKNGRAGRIRGQQKYPLPMNINWVTPNVVFDDAPGS